MTLLRCRFHIVAQEPSDKLQNIVPFEVSIDAQKAYLIIGRLLEVKGDSVKAFSFYMSMKQQLKVNRLSMQNERIWVDRRGNIYLVNAC